MQLTFTASSSVVKNLNLAYPADFAGQGPYEERVSEVAGNWGDFKVSDLWFEGVCICCTDVKLKKNCSIQLQCDSFCWIMNFVLEGDLNARFDDIKPMALKDGRYHTFCTSTLNAGLVVEQSTSLLTICLTRKFIGKLLGKDLLKDVLDANTHKMLNLITKGNYRHTRLQAIVKEIMEASGQSGYIRRIFLESKILELLFFQLQQEESSQVSPKKGFNREDITRLNEAKAYIAQNIKTPCSLVELARKTGLNDFKLKKGFKALFGHTVFGYLYELRMDTAYNLLQNDKSVSEVAEIIGYKNPHHFTAAFKKKFGFLPSQINKMQV